MDCESQPCSPSCLGCKLYGASHAVGPENGAIIDSTGGFQAAFVDSKLRWKTPIGPGDIVSGTWKMVQIDDTYLLYPVDKFSAPGVLHEEHTTRTSNDEARPGTSNRAQLESQITAKKLEEFVSQLRDTSRGGTFFADVESDDIEQSARGMDLEFFRRFLQTGNIPRDDYIAIDVFGQMDVEYDNPGPVLNLVGQITGSGYNSTFNEEEIAAKRRHQRKRMLMSLPIVPSDDPGDLEVELSRLSRSSSISSVSAISVNQDEPNEGYSNCGPDCWLKTNDGFTYESNEAVDKLPRVEDVRSPGLYIYEPLPRGHTRILSIHGGSPGMPIECSLLPLPIHKEATGQPVQQPKDMTFEALSYTWGGQEATEPIICNKKTLFVTKNLWSALRHLRNPEANRFIWADALCINQADLAEKNDQIPLMMDIYKTAAKVIVWLGIHADNSHFAILGMRIMDSLEGRRAILHRAHDSSCLQALKRLLEAQLAFFKRPWFRRTWIRQEVIMAKEVSVTCGETEVGWYLMKRAAKRLNRIHTHLAKADISDLPELNSSVTQPLDYLVRGWVYGQHMLYSIGDIHSVWYYHTGGLLDLLMVGREFDATDPRDKVYSVLGIGRVPMSTGRNKGIYPRRAPRGQQSENQHAENQQLEFMEVDYSKSVSEVYQHLTKYFIHRDRNLDILSIISSHRGSTSHDLPSWAPDWRVSISEMPLKGNWEYFTTKFGAAGFTKADLQDQSELGRLRVQGWPVDQVAALTPFTGNIPSLPLVPHVTIDDFDESKHLRRFCQTRDGRDGLVPRDAQTEDEIFILAGSRLPFVLRALPDQEVQRDEAGQIVDYTLMFEVIGPCWLPDLMHGEAIADYERRDVQPFKIILV